MNAVHFSNNKKRNQLNTHTFFSLFFLFLAFFPLHFHLFLCSLSVFFFLIFNLHTHIHTHTLSLSLCLTYAHVHTHTHTHTYTNLSSRLLVRFLVQPELCKRRGGFADVCGVFVVFRIEKLVATIILRALIVRVRT